MNRREFEKMEFALELAGQFRERGLERRANRLEVCALGQDMTGEGTAYLRSCRDVFCPFCANGRVPVVKAAIDRLTNANLLTFTWSEGVPVATVGQAIRRRWKLCKFAMAGSSGVGKWEFTVRESGMLHLHCHCVTNANVPEVCEAFNVHRVRSVHSVPFDGNALEVAKYLTPSGRVDVIANVALAIHGQRVRTFTAWGECRKFRKLVPEVIAKMPAAEQRKKVTDRRLNGSVWGNLGSRSDEIRPCAE